MRRRTPDHSNELAAASTSPFASVESPKRIREPPTHLPLPPAQSRYADHLLLDQGGMGEVYVCVDRLIGREIAMKAAPRTDLGSRARFLRETLVQAQLEHPALVPLYDAGRDQNGTEFFTMQRISGRTLADVLAALRAGDRAAREKYPMQVLLQTFQTVCLGIAYAHERGVIHRDLKPSNVMLGDFGEVFILDWGLAKVVEVDDRVARVDVNDHRTLQGEALGTIGYMAPEQALDAASVDARVDIYALGAILFEMLALTPLHGSGSRADRLRSTQLGADARPSGRAPDRRIPPELDAICARATALAPKNRHGSCRELHDAVGRFLSGERDTVIRTELALKHALEAEEAATRAIAQGGGEEDRRIAFQQAGRALALDADCERALRVIGRLLTTPPNALPEEARAALEQEEESDGIARLKAAAWALLVIALVVTGAILPGTRSYPGVAAIVIPLLLASALCTYAARRRLLPGGRIPWRVVTAFGLATIAIAMASGLYGPLVLVPTLAAANVALWDGPRTQRFRVPFLLVACASLAIPAVLEWVGILPRAYAFTGERFVIFPVLRHFSEVRIRLEMLVATVATVVVPAFFLWRTGRALEKARADMHTYLWHLNQLVPSKGRASDLDEMQPTP